MKNFLKVSLACLTIGGLIQASCSTPCSTATSSNCSDACNGSENVVSHSFFNVRAPFSGMMPERVSSWLRGCQDLDQGCGANFQLVGFGGKSVKSAKLGSYFFHNGTNSIRVMENPAPSDKVDVISQNLNIVTDQGTFDSTVTINPKQTFGGIGLSWYQALCGNWWLDVETSVLHVRNKVNLCETVKNDGEGIATDANQDGTNGQNWDYNGDGAPAAPNVSATDIGFSNDTTTAANATDNPRVANVAAAFKQTTLKYGRIDDSNCSMKKWGLNDIDVRLCYDWNKDNCAGDCCCLSSYVGVHIPTGNKPKAVNMFEAIVGQTKNAGIQWGVHASYAVWECDESTIWWHLDTQSQYLFRNTQLRSFDLKNKAFSRYQEVFANYAGYALGTVVSAAVDPTLLYVDDEANPVVAANPTWIPNPTTYNPGNRTSLINLTTQCVKVTPGFSFDMNTGFVYKGACGYELELGWNLYARQGEKICPVANLFASDGPAIASDISWDVNNCRTIGDNCAGAEVSAIYSMVGGAAAVAIVADETTTPPTPTVLGNVISNLQNGNPYTLIQAYTTTLSTQDVYNNARIRGTDIDYASGAHPALLSYIVYGALSKDWEACGHELMVGLGGSYEFASANTVMNRWTLWAKVGFEF